MSPWTFLIRNALLYDGSGRPGFLGDVAVAGDRIAAVGTFKSTVAAAATVIDASGLAVAPGFIDVHAHDDFAVLLSPHMDFKVMQGVTTSVVGNCGYGPAPFEPAARFFRGWHPEGDLPFWRSYADYLTVLDRNPPSLNVAVLAGHGCIRSAIMAGSQRASTAAELARLCSLVREALDAGAVGLSTGLVYPPGCYASTDEIVMLARLLAQAGAVYATHLRNEGRNLLPAVREALFVGEVTGVSVQISHHKASGQDNWGRVHDSLELIERARARGIDVTVDQYPYTAGSTMLSALLDNHALDNHGGDGGLGRIGAADILIASSPKCPHYEGKTLEDLASKMGLPAKAAAERVVHEDAGTVVVLMSMCEDDVQTVLRHPATMIGSDGVPASGGKPHPRLYGAFPRVLGRYVRELRLISLPAAIHKMTGMAAAKFRLVDRGVIRAGAFADLVVFDPATVADRGTYTEPRCYPVGIHHVFVNGVPVVRDGQHTGARPGRALRRVG